jgi:hypothetical protein
MQMSDSDLVLALLARDGPQTYRKHRLEGRCRYVDLYPAGNCPWCEAEDHKFNFEGDDC